MPQYFRDDTRIPMMWSVPGCRCCKKENAASKHFAPQSMKVFKAGFTKILIWTVTCHT